MDAQAATAELIKKLAKDKCELYTQLNTLAQKCKTVLVGDSLIENFPINELYHGEMQIYNRGIAGNTTYDILNRLEATVVSLQPKKVFLLAGTNDFMPHVNKNDINSICNRIIQIGDTLVKEVKNSQVYVLSLFPINTSNDSIIYKAWQIGKTNEQIRKLNNHLQELCIKKNYQFIDVYSHLQNESGELDISLTLDGTHVNINAYKIILELIEKYL